MRGEPCQLDVEMTVAAARDAVLAPASRAGFSSVDDFSFSGFALGFHSALAVLAEFDLMPNIACDAVTSTLTHRETPVMRCEVL